MSEPPTAPRCGLWKKVRKRATLLQKSLLASEAKNRELLARESASEEKLAEAIATAEELRERLSTADADKEKLARLQRESDLKLLDALREVYRLGNAPVEVASKGELAGDGTPEDGGRPAAETGSSTASPSELEARNLFGARDLHIVDVYDVTGDGKTKRTYGRVYYVEKKLLVFYAFDLQNRKIHKRGAFQAWGYREANIGKPLGLGLFTIADSAMG